jgi:hypothetical protein
MMANKIRLLTISAMFSCTVLSPPEANRVRVVNGDSVSRYSEHFYDIPVETTQL